MSIRPGKNISSKGTGHAKRVLDGMPERIMSVTLNYGELQYEMDLKSIWLLNIDAKNLPDADLDRVMQDTNIYRMALVKARGDAGELLAKAERAFTHWQAMGTSRAYSGIVRQFERKAGKAPSISRMMAITRPQAVDWLVARPKSYRVYRKHWDRIAALKRQISIIEGAIDTLKAWAYNLNNIAERRAQQRQGARYA